MSFMSWLRHKLGSSQSPRMSEALHLTDDVAHTARELRESIEPFKSAKDPFIALWAHSYEAREERRLHEGTPH